MIGRFTWFSRYAEDKGILKFFWFSVFLLHITFFAMGVYFLHEGYKLIDMSRISQGELRLDHLFIAIYMQSIAFSLILLIIAIYVYVIHQKQTRLELLIDSMSSRSPEDTDPEPGKES